MKCCSNCGKQIDDSVTFCPYCGARQPQLPPQQYQYPQQPQPQQQYQYPQQQYRPQAGVGNAPIGFDFGARIPLLIVSWLIIVLSVLSFIGGAFLVVVSLGGAVRCILCCSAAKKAQSQAEGEAAAQGAKQGLLIAVIGFIVPWIILFVIAGFVGA